MHQRRHAHEAAGVLPRRPMMLQPQGDPVALRSRARVLRLEAEGLSEREGRLRIVRDIPNNVGDVADRYRDAMDRRQARVRRAINELLGLALELDHAADRVEQELLDYQAFVRDREAPNP
jgi:hypothetical protein